MKSADIRSKFLQFFAAKGHQIVASSSLVPHDDPTLLFTNAGMNQFKDVFLGFDKRPYNRATTSQKCVRAGGKHNDLENVGYTSRHHTFFEMLGNFSFGDYFKREAITYAWELLTRTFELPGEKLWVTVYQEDDEAYEIWHKHIGIPAERIVRIGDNKGARYASDNFWMMGDTGPCGPCTEIFYDHGPDVAGGPPGSPDENGDRYIEIWNNVFMQFNRDEAGVMHKLPKPSVDTGMGLERIAAVLQGVHSNYDIDLFQNLIKAAARETRCSDFDSPSLKVLADHIRACSFLIADGVIPGNEGRGYVLRRIIRRAIRHGYKLGVRAAFFHRLVPDLAREMGEAYPELIAHQSRVMDTLKQEEDRFFDTIEHGMAILEAELAQVDSAGTPTLNGETAFKLHDTYGFPLDLTADICRERNVTVDVEGFDAAMARQKEQARAAGKFKMAANLEFSGAPTTFHGYEKLEEQGKVLALYKDGIAVDALQEGDIGVVVLSQFAEEAYAYELLKDGAAGLGYLLKERVANLEELVRALNEVAKGGSVLDPKVVEALVSAKDRMAHSPLAQLTDREREVLENMAQGKNNASIAKSLFLTERAVEKHINSLFHKLGLSEETDVHRRVKAVLAFLRESDHVS